MDADSIDLLKLILWLVKRFGSEIKMIVCGRLTLSHLTTDMIYANGVHS